MEYRDLARCLAEEPVKLIGVPSIRGGGGDGVPEK